MSEKTETFEAKMKNLEEIVRQLDEDEVSLEKSLELYKRGVTLSSECDKILKNAEFEVESLNKEQNENE